MVKKYSMNETVGVAKIAYNDIERYLLSLPETIDVINVEMDSDFQEYDIDVIQLVIEDSILIEIKGDRYYNTGNYFFETVSNKGKNTLGCFLYTKADYLYYYFTDKKELHILPMPETREWFIRNIEMFKEKTTSTSVGKSRYYSKGRLVPRKIVAEEVDGVRIIDLKLFLDKT